MNPKEYAKAIIASLIAGLGSLAAGMDEGLTAQEIVVALLATVVAFGATWGIPNKQPTEQEKNQ